jgi:hypothetical protein
LDHSFRHDFFLALPILGDAKRGAVAAAELLRFERCLGWSGGLVLGERLPHAVATVLSGMAGDALPVVPELPND